MALTLHTLAPALGSRKKSKRKGRGQGSGKGGHSSTKGQKGAQSRSGYKRKLHHEGGQMPFARRTPKHGFTRHNKVVFKPVNLDLLESIAEAAGTAELNSELLCKYGVIRSNEPYKVLARGKLTRAIHITTPFCSAAALQAIQEQGGTVTISK